ncbi:MAG: nucleotidyltransferase domain-containing protein [Bacilli bacterium]
MDNDVKERLMRRNRELIDILREKIRTEYREDIDLVGVCGSFFTGDFHEHSDLDLLVVVNNNRAHGFSKCFILDGVGFDFYGSSWSKLETMASWTKPLARWKTPSLRHHG